jgi:hypothetical protein
LTEINLNARRSYEHSRPTVFKEDDRVRFVLGATHHGFIADASEVDGELERVVNEIRRAHPDLTVD